MGTQMRRASAFILRLPVGALFAFAGVMKTLDPAAFLKAIENYQLLPHGPAAFAAFYLPGLEILCGTGLMFKRLRKGATLLLILMTLVFLAALLSAWARGLNIECGCFGDGDGAPNYGVALARDLTILAALCGSAWLDKQPLANSA